MADKIFIQDLRRLLYISQIVRNEAQIMLSNKDAPPIMKNASKRILNATNAMFADMKHFAPNSMPKVMKELNSDELFDTSCMLELCAEITNVGELVEVLKEHIEIQNKAA